MQTDFTINNLYFKVLQNIKQILEHNSQNYLSYLYRTIFKKSYENSKLLFWGAFTPK